MEHLAALVGYRLGDQTRLLLERALGRAADALSQPPEVALERLRARAPEAWQAFSAAVAIHETYFFRHPEHFEVLEAKAREAAARGAPLRSAWSVGCATGEEAWSLALALYPWSADLRVAGSDLSPEALAVARAGRYPARAFRDPASAARPGLFPVGGGFEVAERIRQLAVFAPLNLAHDPVRPPPGMPAELDVIFCRNVLVYLTPEVGARVVGELASLLAPDGLLVLGAVEAPEQLPPELELQDPSLPGVFRRARPGAGRRVPPPRPRRVTPGRVAAAPEQDPRTQAALEDARRLADEGRMEDALARVEGLEGSPEALYLAASIQLEARNTAQAGALLQKVVRLSPAFVPAHLQLALMAHRRGDLHALERHRDAVERLLFGRGDDEALGADGMRAGWARQVLQSLAAEAGR